jgi:hypothetical protein
LTHKKEIVCQIYNHQILKESNIKSTHSAEDGKNSTDGEHANKNEVPFWEEEDELQNAEKRNSNGY